MDVSEVRARPDGKGVAQTDWSGCAPLEANLALADGQKLIDSAEPKVRRPIGPI
jgi:hypothetical protein